MRADLHECDSAVVVDGNEDAVPTDIACLLGALCGNAIRGPVEAARIVDFNVRSSLGASCAWRSTSSFRLRPVSLEMSAHCETLSSVLLPGRRYAGRLLSLLQPVQARVHQDLDSVGRHRVATPAR